MLAAIVAHGGSFGWDEALFTIAPLLLFAVLLIVAKRRADALDDDTESSD